MNSFTTAQIRGGFVGVEWVLLFGPRLRPSGGASVMRPCTLGHVLLLGAGVYSFQF